MVYQFVPDRVHMSLELEVGRIDLLTYRILRWSNCREKLTLRYNNTTLYKFLANDREWNDRFTLVIQCCTMHQR